MATTYHSKNKLLFPNKTRSCKKSSRNRISLRIDWITCQSNKLNSSMMTSILMMTLPDSTWITGWRSWRSNQSNRNMDPSMRSQETNTSEKSLKPIPIHSSSCTSIKTITSFAIWSTRTCQWSPNYMPTSSSSR